MGLFTFFTETKKMNFEEQYKELQTETERKILFGTENEDLKPKSEIVNYQDKGIELPKIELTKDLVLDLLRGVRPSFTNWSNPLIKGCFDYSDQYGVFNWKSEINEFSVERIYEMYKLCKIKD